MFWKVLRISLVVLAAWAVRTTDSELDWTHKKSLAQKERRNKVLLEGEHCGLRYKVRKPRTAPQNHLFGVYPSRAENYQNSYPVRSRRTQNEAWSQQNTVRQAPSGVSQDLTENPAGVRRASEQPAAPWVGDGPIGQSELRRNDDTYLGKGGSKEALGEPATRGSSETAASTVATFEYQNGPAAETQREGETKSRLPHQVQKRQAEVTRDPRDTPQDDQLWPKNPRKRGESDSPLAGTIQNGGGVSDWKAETFNPQGGLPVLYFSGKRERLLLRPEVLAEIPREAFTVEAWVRPEGGQSNPVIIAGNVLLCYWAFSAPGGVTGFISVVSRTENKNEEQAKARKAWPEGVCGCGVIYQSSILDSIKAKMTPVQDITIIDLLVFYPLRLRFRRPQLSSSPLLKGADLNIFVKEEGEPLCFSQSSMD